VSRHRLGSRVLPLAGIVGAILLPGANRGRLSQPLRFMPPSLEAHPKQRWVAL
jgi:hypothetical protein